MKYFTVRRSQIVGDIVEGNVGIDGEFLELPETIEQNETKDLEFVVYEYEEDGMEIDTKYYDNIDAIVEEHQPDMWQNNEW